ncbi:uncharacterized protein LOC130984960 [Salvia miltiorrhiza]|uniref:uncharacterized protein LOC130984960 n=1 Tax=Salvia miltiorrhiza TaxID=226208 RepID=UPI0025ACE4EA|nr:uncharacterized protein LOC130984960 [Salvia miltiorrhiza]
MAPDASDALAEMEKFQQFLNAAQTGNLDLLKKLAKQLDSGKGLAQTVVDVKDANQRGALHFAAREGQTEICKYLLEELKMDINTKDEDGDTPLTHAARQGHTALAKYLVDHGADPSIPSGLGTTALHHSAGRGNERRRIKEKEESVERGRTKFREEEIGEQLRGEILSHCAACQRIPVFPTSLPKKLGHDQSGSGASSSAASCAGTRGMVDTEDDQVVNIVCSMEERGLISTDELSKILDLVDEWFKQPCIFLSFLLSSTPSLEIKAQVLKHRLRP